MIRTLITKDHFGHVLQKDLGTLYTMLKKPENAITSEKSTVWLTTEGIAVCLAAQQDRHTLDDAYVMFQNLRKVIGEQKYPLLVDISGIKFMTKKARSFYSSRYVSESLYCVALVSNTYYGVMVGNFFIHFTPRLLPVKLFTNAELAIPWLLKTKNNLLTQI